MRREQASYAVPTCESFQTCLTKICEHLLFPQAQILGTPRYASVWKLSDLDRYCQNLLKSSGEVASLQTGYLRAMVRWSLFASAKSFQRKAFCESAVFEGCIKCWYSGTLCYEAQKLWL